MQQLVFWCNKILIDTLNYKNILFIWSYMTNFGWIDYEHVTVRAYEGDFLKQKLMKKYITGSCFKFM